MGNERKTELENFNLDPQTERLLEETGWLNFIHMYEGYELDLVEEFVRNFHVNFTRVRGEVIEVNP